MWSLAFACSVRNLVTRAHLSDSVQNNYAPFWTPVHETFCLFQSMRAREFYLNSAQNNFSLSALLSTCSTFTHFTRKPQVATEP